jgi:hypothetical protein
MYEFMILLGPGWYLISWGSILSLWEESMMHS